MYKILQKSYNLHEDFPRPTKLEIKMNKIIILILLSLSYVTLAAENDQDFERLLAAIPEIAEPPAEIKSTNPTMKCLVDTPAFDHYGTGICFGVAWPYSTLVVFKIDYAPSNFTIIWSNPSCSQQSTYCSMSIQHYDPITLSATVLDNSNGTFTTTSATAYYEGYD